MATEPGDRRRALPRWNAARGARGGPGRLHGGRDAGGSRDHRLRHGHRQSGRAEVVHLDLPASLETYFQEVGRAGREPAPARGVLLHTSPNEPGAALGSRGAPDGCCRPRRSGLVRQRQEVGEAIFQIDDLERDLEMEKDALRIALSVLERAGALRRGYDVPQVFSLRWAGARGDVEFAAFVSPPTSARASASRSLPPISRGDRDRAARSGKEAARVAGARLDRSAGQRPRAAVRFRATTRAAARGPPRVGRNGASGGAPPRCAAPLPPDAALPRAGDRPLLRRTAPQPVRLLR